VLSCIFLLILISIPCEAIYLRWGLLGDGLEGFSPFIFPKSDVFSMTNSIWESLYTYAPETFEYIPWMADGIYQMDLENKTCVVSLKKGIKWSDGKPVTANDIVFTANVIINLKIPGYYRYFEFVKSVKKIDTYTVLYTLKEVRSIFVFGTLMQMIIPEHIWKPVVKKAAESKKPHKFLLAYKPSIDMMVGDGMFIPKEWVKGDHILFVANPNYFARGRQVKGRNKKYIVGPYVDGIYYKIYKDIDTAILDMQRGELDYIQSYIPPDRLPLLFLDQNVVLTELPENGICYLSWNLRKKPFSDEKFRKALTYLIDKPYIQSKILRNMGTWLSTVVPPCNTYWHDPLTMDYGNKIGMNEGKRLAKAREILVSAGYYWDENEKLYYKDGTSVKPFSILIPSVNFDPVRTTVGILIQRWWKKIGLSINLIPISPSDIMDKVFVERNFDCWISIWRLTLFPDYLRTLFVSEEDTPGGSNPEGYHDEAFDKEANLFVQTLDMSRARKICFDLQEKIQDTLPYVPLYVRTIVEVHSKRSMGWIEQLNGIGNKWSLAFLKLAY